MDFPDNSPTLAPLLERWYALAARALPWRATRDPYSIWISEVMLQQTRVAVVIPYYQLFLERFPTVQALAAAEEKDVLPLWAGLGYYSRARNLHRGAQDVVQRFGGRFPESPEELRTIRGIGPYTAGAISSIAFDRPSPLVDGNVQRVLSRLYAFGEPLGARAAETFFWDRAGKLVRAAQSPRLLNQALMELGATVCAKASPRCAQCPVAGECRALAADSVEQFPVRKAKRASVELRWAALVAEDSEGRLFLAPARRGRWWEGLYDFPRTELADDAEPENAATSLAATFGTAHVELLGAATHTVTHHRIRVFAFRTRAENTVPLTSKFPEGRWTTASDAARMGLSGLARKLLALAATH